MWKVGGATVQLCIMARDLISLSSISGSFDQLSFSDR